MEREAQHILPTNEWGWLLGAISRAERQAFIERGTKFPTKVQATLDTISNRLKARVAATQQGQKSQKSLLMPISGSGPQWARPIGIPGGEHAEIDCDDLDFAEADKKRTFIQVPDRRPTELGRAIADWQQQNPERPGLPGFSATARGLASN